jgi:RNA polymerase sigma-70 factor, ECF subfamily
MAESTDRVTSAAASAAEPGAATDERALLERLRSGDDAAFDEVVGRYQSVVYRAALAALGSPAEAEEAAQDAFVAAFRRLDTFRGEASFKTWLLAIAWRKALTRRRKLQFWNPRAALRASAGEDSADPLEVLAGQDADPQAALLGLEARRDVRRMIRTLPRKLRDPLLLVAGGTCSYQEAAALQSLPVGTVKWRVHEARRVLREKLRALGYGT